MGASLVATVIGATASIVGATDPATLQTDTMASAASVFAAAAIPVIQAAIQAATPAIQDAAKTVAGSAAIVGTAAAPYVAVAVPAVGIGIAGAVVGGMVVNKLISSENAKDKMIIADAEKRVKEVGDALYDANRREKEQREARENAEDKVREEREALDVAERREREERVAREDAERRAREERWARETAEKRVREEKEARENAEKRAKEESKARKDAENRAREEKEAREHAEKDSTRLAEDFAEKDRCLENGIQPIKRPTEEELRSVKERLQYEDGYFHLAVTGTAGSGKSSLINAFRGLHNKDPRAAKTGVIETTSEIGRYPDPDGRQPRKSIIWYDVPGAGTLDVTDWQYFNEQGLFIFDLIILVVGIRFTKIDLAILENSQRFRIPVFIVRSKADQDIRNNLQDMIQDSDAESPEDYAKARDDYIADARKSINSNLKKAGLPSQMVYIVSKDSLRTLVKGEKVSKDIIDEVKLNNDLLRVAHERRNLDQLVTGVTAL